MHDFPVYKASLDAASNAIVISDMQQPDQPIIYVNSAFEHMSGYRADEILGKNCRILNKGEQPEELKKVRSALKNGKKIKTILKNYRKDGSLFWNELHLSPVYNPKGTVTHFVGVQNDITERVHIKQQLQLRSAALGIATDGILIVDAGSPEYPIIYASAKFTELTGYSQQEVTGKNCRFLQGAKTDPHTRESIKTALKDKTGFQGEILNYRKDGTPFWNMLRIEPIHNERGEVTHFLGVQTDISFLKEQEFQQEKLLQEVSQKNTELQEIKQALDDHFIVAITDAKGIITSVNKKFCDISGYTSSELLGKTHNMINSGFHSKNFFTQMWQTIAQGNTWKGDIKNKAKDGSFYWVATTIVPFLRKGSPHQYIAIRNDITAKKEQELHNKKLLKNISQKHQKLKESRFLLAQKNEKMEFLQKRDEALLHSIGEGIFATDKQGHIILVNKAACDLVGMNESDILHQHLSRVFILEDEQGNIIPPEKRHSRKAFDQQRQITVTLHDTPHVYYRRKDGTRFIVGLTVTPVFLGQEICGIIQVFRDISREVEVNKAKTEFVSLASHQLRTPLSAIKWYTEMLLKDASLGTEQQDLLQEIRIGNERIIALVQALLNVSRVDLGMLSIAPEKVNISALLSQIKAENQTLLSEKNISVREKYGEGIQFFYSDKKLLTIILQNLFSNAVKYTPPQGKITFSATWKKSQSDNSAPHVQCVIRDTGYGIPASQQDKIFSKLFRADNVLTKDTEGSGLGLYIVKMMTEKLGGTILCSSQENRGTVFYLDIPCLSTNCK